MIPLEPLTLIHSNGPADPRAGSKRNVSRVEMKAITSLPAPCYSSKDDGRLFRGPNDSSELISADLSVPPHARIVVSEDDDTGGERPVAARKRDVRQRDDGGVAGPEQPHGNRRRKVVVAVLDAGMNGPQ